MKTVVNYVVGMQGQWNIQMVGINFVLQQTVNSMQSGAAITCEPGKKP